MDSRQRVYRAIEMTGADRVAVVHRTLPGPVARHGQAPEDLDRRCPEDVVNVGEATLGESGSEIGTASRDAWGCLWVHHGDEGKGQVTYHPLADRGALDDCRQPDFAGDEKTEAMLGEVACCGNRRLPPATSGKSPMTLQGRGEAGHGANDSTPGFEGEETS